MYDEMLEELAAIGTGMWIFIAVAFIFTIICWWKIFVKAGRPGWAAIVPIYDLVVTIQVAKKPWWWILLLLIPFANIVFLIMIYHGVSKAFGKSAGFTVGLLFLSIIFLPILAFGNAEYR